MIYFQIWIENLLLEMVIKKPPSRLASYLFSGVTELLSFYSSWKFSSHHNYYTVEIFCFDTCQNYIFQISTKYVALISYNVHKHVLNCITLHVIFIIFEHLSWLLSGTAFPYVHTHKAFIIRNNCVCKIFHVTCIIISILVSRHIPEPYAPLMHGHVASW